MNENEEFEFRYRLEQEQGASGGKPSLGFGDVMEMIPDAPWTRLRNATLEPAGEMVAEAGGQMGFPATGAALGTAVQMAPELLSTYAGMRGLYQSQSPTVRGLINTPQELSPQYGIQNQAIGVTKTTPLQGGRVPTYAKPELQGLATRPPRPLVPAEPLPGVVPERLPSQPADFMSYASGKLDQFGNRINPQELMNWHTKLSNDMANPSVIPRFDQSGGTTQIYQQASDLQSRIKSTFNPMINENLKKVTLPEGVFTTREGLNKAYSVAKTVQGVTRTTMKIGGSVIGTGVLLEYVRRKMSGGR